MSKPKPIRPSEIDPLTQLWHGLVDTLRLLPSVPTSSRPLTFETEKEREKELKAAQREKKVLDEAFEQVNNLLRARRGSDGSLNVDVGGSGGGAQGMPGRGTTGGPGPAIGSGGQGDSKGESPASAALATLKRKRDRRLSISVSPAPQVPPQSAPVESLSLPTRLDAGPGPRSANTPGGHPMSASHSHTGHHGSALLPGSAAAAVRANSPLLPSRSGTPTSRQLTGREKRDLISDQLPLQKGRRVLFKQPKDKKEEGEEEVWIVGTIVTCIGGDKNRYTVRDADTETDITYNTTLRSIIPLPDASLPLTSSAHPSNIDDYPKGTQVLALYPETTSFYPAKVLVPPSRSKADAGRKVYRVFFEGDDVQAREVAAGDMVLLPGAN